NGRWGFGGGHGETGRRCRVPALARVFARYREGRPVYAKRHARWARASPRADNGRYNAVPSAAELMTTCGAAPIVRSGINSAKASPLRPIRQRPETLAIRRDWREAHGPRVPVHLGIRVRGPSR